MEKKHLPPEWAPRIPKAKIRRLYHLDAAGIYDDDLIDDVGYSLLARCTSFLEANQAVGGKAPCPVCGSIITHNRSKKEILHCEKCGWELSWGEYFATIQKKQLSGAEPVIKLIENYIREFPSASTSQEKVFLIDRLIHGFHWHQKFGATRPVAINLIEGRLSDVIEFLDQLSYGEKSTPGTLENRDEWLVNSEYARSWGGKEKGDEEK